jgi:hypothetical protein
MTLAVVFDNVGGDVDDVSKAEPETILLSYNTKITNLIGRTDRVDLTRK